MRFAKHCIQFLPFSKAQYSKKSSDGRVGMGLANGVRSEAVKKSDPIELLIGCVIKLEKLFLSGDACEVSGK